MDFATAILEIRKLREAIVDIEVKDKEANDHLGAAESALLSAVARLKEINK